LCLFIDGSSGPRIRADVARHVRSLGAAHSQDSFEDCLLFLSRSTLAGQRLIVYDNVDDPQLDLAPLLPTGDSCVVIVTSRNHLIGGLCTAHLKLDAMSIEEAIKLLLLSTDPSVAVTNQAKKDARAIAEALGCLPIALQQARSYMSQTQCSASAYLQRLVENRDKLLAQPAKFQLDMASISTYSAFEMSFKKLALQSQKFLRLLSNFHWSKFPLELVVLAAKLSFSQYRVTYIEHGDDFYEGRAVLEDIFLRDGKWNVINLDEMMNDLQNYSLVTSIPGVDTTLVQMHPLAHGWVKMSIPEPEKGAYQSAAVLLLALGARDEYTSCAQYLTSHINHLSALWGQLNINNAEAFSSILGGGGVYEGALQLRKRVATELRNQVEPDNMNIANSISALADSYRSVGRPKDAEPLQREALRLTTDVLGDRHPDAITASTNLAFTYYDLGRLKEAQVLQEEVLKRMKEIGGKRNLGTIGASNNLANTYFSLGRLKEAEALQEEVLKLSKEILGERHPDTIGASNNLALTYRELGRPKEAVTLQENILKLRKKILGERHPDTIMASSNLALSYRDQGRLKEAMELQEEVLILRKDILGERHPDTISASSNLAPTYCYLGRLKEAAALQEEALKIRKEILGARHPDTIAASNDLADYYLRSGRLQDAETLQVETLRQAQEMLGNEHPTTTISMLTLAEIYEALCRKSDALKLLDAAELIYTKTVEKDNIQFLECQQVRARVQALPDSPSPRPTPGIPPVPTHIDEASSPRPIVPPKRRSRFRRFIVRLRQGLPKG
jgi:tetratricopeptide (TPR) repeat protein